MKIKRKTQALSYLFETEPPHDEHGTHSALLHSPSTHNRAEGVRGRRYRLEIQKWSLNFMRSRDEEMQMKRHTFGAHSILPNRLKRKEPSKPVAAVATLSPAVVARGLR